MQTQEASLKSFFVIQSTHPVATSHIFIVLSLDEDTK